MMWVGTGSFLRNRFGRKVLENAMPFINAVHDMVAFP